MPPPVSNGRRHVDAEGVESILVKDVAQPGLVLAGMARTLVLRLPFAIALRFARGRCGGLRRRPFDELVEFTAIQPHAAARWAVIDFDALAVSHLQRRFLAYRTLHA